LTADRASLLVSQDPDAVVNALMKLAGGTRRLYAQMDKEAFLEQGREYHELGKDFLNQFFQMGQTLQTTHPFPAVRALEADAWAKSKEWKSILEGNYGRRQEKPKREEAEERPKPAGDGSVRKCPQCKAVVRYRTFLFCPECGADLPS
jgi:hypothetical protein